MATVSCAPPTPLGGIDGLPLGPVEPWFEDFLNMPIDGYDGEAGSSYGDQMIGVELQYYMDSAEESLNVPRQSSSLTGVAVAASDPMPSYGGSTVASHPPNHQSTVRAAIESVSGGSSRSPATASQILTPASETHLDYNASISGSNLLEDEDTDDNLSPTSDRSYVFVSHPQSYRSTARRGPQNSHMSNYRQQPSSSQDSGASDVQHLSRASSLAPSTASFAGGQWGNFHVSNTSFMDNQHAQHLAPNNTGYYVPSSYPPGSNAFAPSGQAYGDVITDLAADMFNTPVPFRPAYDHHMFAQNIIGGSSAMTPGYQQAHLQAYNQANLTASQQPRHDQLFGHQHETHHHGAGYPTQLNIPSTGSLMVQPQDPLTAPPKMEQVRSSPSPMHPAPQFARRSIPSVPSHRNSPYPQPDQRTGLQNTATPQSRPQYPTAGTSRQPASSGTAANRPLQAAKARSTLPSNATRASGSEKGRKGGRQRGVHLADHAKVKSSQMRKVVACWRCALQRDPCDPGMPCNRCEMRAQKGQAYFFGCDRSKLPDFVHDFLPAQATMTLMHQKQTIEDTVSDQVLQWDKDHPITVYLTSGYGPPLRWSLHEFKPRTKDLLGQYQYLQDPRTGLQQRYHKYSPPFGLLKLDATDDTYLENYLRVLLSKEYLWDLGWTFFEEESQVDESSFQARLVELMCNLYLHTEDKELGELLQQILRMLVITYIMGHTLTICEETLPSVLDAIRWSEKGPTQAFTSPRLANRQLKFYFSVFRSNIYEKILKWQQQTFHTSGKKEETFLLSFCAMLGFAMVLEEVQRTIMIQADAKAAKEEATWEQATTEANNACERIDERFRLLVGLFQCKYRDKKWGERGSFGPQTPRMQDETEHKFLRNVRELLEENVALLQNRQNVQFGVENQCQYTSRLVARFLLPFLALPGQ